VLIFILIKYSYLYLLSILIYLYLPLEYYNYRKMAIRGFELRAPAISAQCSALSTQPLNHRFTHLFQISTPYFISYEVLPQFAMLSPLQDLWCTMLPFSSVTMMMHTMYPLTLSLFHCYPTPVCTAPHLAKVLLPPYDAPPIPNLKP
jgi:hypothetical protein